MADSYDVVVVGAGVGGLCATARLAAAGCKVLLLERMSFLGGRFSDIEVDGTHVSTGAIGIEVGGPFQEAFDLLDAPFDVVAPPSGAGLRYRFRDQWVVATEGGGLRNLIMQAAQDDDEGSRVYAAFKRALGWELPGPGVSLVDWLGTFTNNREIIGIFTGICDATHGPGERVPARHFMEFIKVQQGYRNFGFSPHGNRALVDGLAKALRERGVEIVHRAWVTAIDVERYRVRGVTFEHLHKRRTVQATAVISNVGPRGTIHLGNEINFEPGYRAQADRMRPMSVVATILRSDEPFDAFPGVSVPSLSGTERVSFVASPTLLAPGWAGGGPYHVTESYGMVRDETAWDDEIEANLKDLETLTPWFRRDRHVLRINCFSGDWPCYHAVPGDDLPQRTPVEFLYNVGDGVKPDGWSGIGACAESARLVAADLTDRLGRVSRRGSS